jgi:hypothetical protein
MQQSRPGPDFIVFLEVFTVQPFDQIRLSKHILLTKTGYGQTKFLYNNIQKYYRTTKGLKISDPEEHRDTNTRNMLHY